MTITISTEDFREFSTRCEDWHRRLAEHIAKRLISIDPMSQRHTTRYGSDYAALVKDFSQNDPQPTLASLLQ